MNANATWDLPTSPPTIGRGNARWGEDKVRIAVDDSSHHHGLVDSSNNAAVPLRKKGLPLGLNVGLTFSPPGSGKSIRKKLDSFSLLGKRFGSAKVNDSSVSSSSNSSSSNKKAMAVSASTSALSHMVIAPIKEGQEPTKLRPDTLRSLGISVPSRQTQTTLKSAMKKGNQKGMSRALTMASIREIEVCLPGKERIKRNTSVNFKETTTIRKIVSSSSLAENPNELWFQNDEMRQIRQRCKSVASMGDYSKSSEDMVVSKIGESMRGLERMMPSNRKIKSQQKYKTWDAVLDMQDLLYDKGERYDDEKIASLYRNISRESLLEAQQRAKQDEQAIREGATTERDSRSGLAMRRCISGEA